MVGQSALDGIEPPGARYAFQFLLSSLIEFEIRSDHQVRHCPGDEHFAGLSESRHPGCNMYRYTRYVIATKLNFSSVQSCPDVETQRLYLADDRSGAFDSAPWTIEGYQGAVAC